eukprot:2863249-Karenia_brevis.AAC.1
MASNQRSPQAGHEVERERTEEGLWDVRLSLSCLCRFLPTFCPEFKRLSGEVAPSVFGVRKYGEKEERKVGLCWWLAAWDGYSLCATVLDQ